MSDRYYAYVELRGEGRGRILETFDVKEDAIKWCENVIAKGKGDVIRAHIDKRHSEPREEKVWEWSSAEPGKEAGREGRHQAMTERYDAYVELRGEGNSKIRNFFDSKKDGEIWCRRMIEFFGAEVLRAWVDKDRPEPKGRKVWKVWEWIPPKPG